MDTKVNGADTPSGHWESKQGEMGSYSDMRYSPEFKNPEEMKKAEKGLSDYCKNNRMKY